MVVLLDSLMDLAQVAFQDIIRFKLVSAIGFLWTVREPILMVFVFNVMRATLFWQEQNNVPQWKLNLLSNQEPISIVRPKMQAVTVWHVGLIIISKTTLVFQTVWILNVLHSTLISSAFNVTTQKSTTSITTIFALKINLIVKSLIFKVVTVLNAIPDIPCIMVNVFCLHQPQRVRHPDLLND